MSHPLYISFPSRPESLFNWLCWYCFHILCILQTKIIKSTLLHVKRGTEKNTCMSNHKKIVRTKYFSTKSYFFWHVHALLNSHSRTHNIFIHKTNYSFQRRLYYCYAKNNGPFFSLSW